MIIELPGSYPPGYDPDFTYINLQDARIILLGDTQNLEKGMDSDLVQIRCLV
jgi:hypothetical protein